LATLSPLLGQVGLMFGPHDYCALMLLGFFCVSFVTTGSLLNGLAMTLIGVLLGLVGTDVNSGVSRFTLDLPFLMDGIGLISIALGCFGIAEIVKNLDDKQEISPFNGTIKLMPTWPEFKRIMPSALRGSVIGSVLGVLPGGGPVIAQFAAYAAEKRFSKFKEEIGHGAIEGVAGQAAADEAAARTSFIPLMSLGIPENAVMALMMAAFVVTLPIACLEAESVRWTHEMMGALAWSVVGLTLGGSSLLYVLIQRGAAASVTSLMYLVPPTTAVMAWVLFDEPITVLTLAGIAVTALGVSLVVRTPVKAN